MQIILLPIWSNWAAPVLHVETTDLKVEMFKLWDAMWKKTCHFCRNWDRKLIRVYIYHYYAIFSNEKYDFSFSFHVYWSKVWYSAWWCCRQSLYNFLKLCEEARTAYHPWASATGSSVWNSSRFFILLHLHMLPQIAIDFHEHFCHWVTFITAN